MSNETIMLAKGFCIEKVAYPAYITEKLDGVAVKIMGRGKEFLPNAVTRQDEDSLAINHILEHLAGKLVEGYALVGELYIPGKPFKYISGLSRRDDTQEELRLFVYDMYNMYENNEPYCSRRSNMRRFVGNLNSPFIQTVCNHKEWVCMNEAELKQGIEALMPNVKEGLVIRSGDEVYCEGKRSWGMQKLKQKATADLKVIGIEEAISKEGYGMRMVGRIIVLWHSKPVGVGPGKMIHIDRQLIWKHPYHLINQIIEVDYMPDPSYNAMREPRFIRYRPDKTEESYE